jgi:hypothetical protein
LCNALLPFSLEFNNLRLSNPNIGAHRVCARKNTHKIPPKKRSRKELSVEGPAQGTRAQILKPTQQTSSAPIGHCTVGRHEEPPQQPPRQAEVLTTDTSAPATQHPNQLQNSEAQEEPQQDSKEEIKVVIEAELACFHHENEHLQLMQEQGQKKGNGKKGTGHAATDQTGVSDSSRTSTSNRAPSSSRK